ncbi:MAG: type II/IV secretion system ATPase subunit [Candidatus Bathyarchaeia archaeon]
MGLLDRLRKDRLTFSMPSFLAKHGQKEEELPFAIDEGVSVQPYKEKYTVVEEYKLDNPFATIRIVSSPELGEGNHYFVVESPLEPKEYEAYNRVVGILSKELEPPTDEEVTPEAYVKEQTELLFARYKNSLKNITDEGLQKIMYYVLRNVAGYGPIHAMMRDPNIEDISLNGLNTPIFVWHRKYESIPSNVRFIDNQTANDFIVKLAHRSGKHISSAIPVLDAMLPEKHRLAATFMKEVSAQGSTFCIRKFRADPFSVIDLISMGTIDARLAAYFWLILEYKMSFMVIGGTGAGKTSLLNALLSLMSQNDKIVTVEEVTELNPPLPNWTQLVSRQTFAFGSGMTTPINLFDLVRLSLRYRPEYIIVGEVRGEEAYVLFQALATGHGGLCTMHSDSLDHCVKRLTSPPMNVSPIYIPLMNCALHIERVELPVKQQGLTFGRRVRTVWEIEDFEKYREVATWDPQTDKFHTSLSGSYLLKRIAAKTGVTIDEVLQEIQLRELYLTQIQKSGIRDQRSVAQKMLAYQTMKMQRRVGIALEDLEQLAKAPAPMTGRS